MDTGSEHCLSVIIPALNEEGRIGEAIASAFAAGADEVIVADGGSSDATRARARVAGACVVDSMRGRGIQLLTGTLAAKGDVLLFLHADAVLPDVSKQDIHKLLAEADAGFFRLAYDRQCWMLRLVAWAANIRSVQLSLPYGDQALFMRRSVYDALGGFQRYPFLEDLDLVIKLRRKYSLRWMSSSVTVSSRRLLQPYPFAPLLLSLRNVMIALLFCLGVSPERLVRLYR